MRRLPFDSMVKLITDALLSMQKHQNIIGVLVSNILRLHPSLRIFIHIFALFAAGVTFYNSMIWNPASLHISLASPYTCYQFWLHIRCRGTIIYFKYFLISCEILIPLSSFIGTTKTCPNSVENTWHDVYPLANDPDLLD